MNYNGDGMEPLLTAIERLRLTIVACHQAQLDVLQMIYQSVRTEPVPLPQQSNAALLVLFEQIHNLTPDLTLKRFSDMVGIKTSRLYQARKRIKDKAKI